MPVETHGLDKMFEVYQFQVSVRMGNLRNVDPDGGSV